MQNTSGIRTQTAVYYGKPSVVCLESLPTCTSNTAEYRRTLCEDRM